MIQEREQITFDSMLFPGRRTLYVSEVAEKWRCSEQHVIDLCEEGRIPGAFDVGGGGEKKYWRIPIEGYEWFMKNRSEWKTEGAAK